MQNLEGKTIESISGKSNGYYHVITEDGAHYILKGFAIDVNGASATSAETEEVEDPEFEVPSEAEIRKMKKAALQKLLKEAVEAEVEGADDIDGKQGVTELKEELVELFHGDEEEEEAEEEEEVEEDAEEVDLEDMDLEELEEYCEEEEIEIPKKVAKLKGKKKEKALRKLIEDSLEEED